MPINETERIKFCKPCDNAGKSAICTIKPSGPEIQEERIKEKYCGFARHKGKQGEITPKGFEPWE